MNRDKVSEHYSGDAGEAYVAARQNDPGHFGFELNAAFFRPYLSATDSLLDFGCGNGGMLTILKAEVAAAVGFEVNPASASVAASVSGCEIITDYDRLPTEPSYDVVVSNHVLEHVRDVCGTLERIRSVLRPGGRLVLKLPLDDWRERRQHTWSTADVDHHLHTWTPRLLANSLMEAGFEVQESRVLTYCWHPRLFPLLRIRLVSRLVAYLTAMIWKRRQLFAVARKAQT